MPNINPTLAWLLLAIVFAVAEIMTTSMVSIWFVAGSIGALLVALVAGQAIPLQIITFIVISGSTLFFTRPILAKKILKKTPTNADMLIGHQVIVTKKITPQTKGRVKSGGLTWQARADHDISEGETCTVKKIEGVTLVVTKQTTTV